MDQFRTAADSQEFDHRARPLAHGQPRVFAVEADEPAGNFPPVGIDHRNRIAALELTVDFLHTRREKRFAGFERLGRTRIHRQPASRFQIAGNPRLPRIDRRTRRFKQRCALAAIDGLPLQEVAELTESSLVATKTRVWRARREVMKRAQKDPVLASYVADLGGGE